MVERLLRQMSCRSGYLALGRKGHIINEYDLEIDWLIPIVGKAELAAQWDLAIPE